MRMTLLTGFSPLPGPPRRGEGEWQLLIGKSWRSRSSTESPARLRRAANSSGPATCSPDIRFELSSSRGLISSFRGFRLRRFAARSSGGSPEVRQCESPNSGEPPELRTACEPAGVTKRRLVGQTASGGQLASRTRHNQKTPLHTPVCRGPAGLPTQLKLRDGNRCRRKGGSSWIRACPAVAFACESDSNSAPLEERWR